MDLYTYFNAIIAVFNFITSFFHTEIITFTEVEAHIVSLQSESTLAIFLAGVQAQIVASTVDDTSTGFERGANALGLIGVVLDVIGAFLALWSATLIQTNQMRAKHFMERVTDCNQKQAADLLYHLQTHGLDKPKIFRNKTLFERTVMLQLAEKLLKKTEERVQDNKEEIQQPRQESLQQPQVPPAVAEMQIYGISMEDYKEKLEFDRLRKASHIIDQFRVIGNAAGTAILVGVLCLLGSVICLAVVSQPRSVWIPVVVSCSCIILLPMTNRMLKRIDTRLPNPFEL